MHDGHGFGSASPAWRSDGYTLTAPIALQGLEVPRRSWVVPAWVPSAQVTMLGGDGGIGKTLVAQQLLTACAAGRDWLGLPASHIKACGFFCEDDLDELHRRQCAINEHYQIEFGDLEDLGWHSFAGAETSLVDYGAYHEPPMTTEVYAQITTTAVNFGAQLVVLDSLHDFFTGNENDRAHARYFVNRLRDLAVAIKGAVVFTAHPSLTGLSSGSGYSGSTAWNNAVRSRLYLQRPKDDGNGDVDSDERELKAMKTNYARSGATLKLAWREGVMVAIEEPTGIFAHIDHRRAETAFLELLRAVTAEGRPVSDNSRAGNFAPKLFSSRPDRQGFGRQEFSRAMEGLFTAGVIGVESYGRASDTRKRIVQTNEVEL